MKSVSGLCFFIAMTCGSTAFAQSGYDLSTTDAITFRYRSMHAVVDSILNVSRDEVITDVTFVHHNGEPIGYQSGIAAQNNSGDLSSSMVSLQFMLAGAQTKNLTTVRVLDPLGNVIPPSTTAPNPLMCGYKFLNGSWIKICYSTIDINLNGTYFSLPAGNYQLELDYTDPISGSVTKVFHGFQMSPNRAEPVLN